MRGNSSNEGNWSSSDAPGVYIVFASGARRRETAVPTRGKRMTLNRIRMYYTSSRGGTGRH